MECGVGWTTRPLSPFFSPPGISQDHLPPARGGQGVCSAWGTQSTMCIRAIASTHTPRPAHLSPAPCGGLGPAYTPHPQLELGSHSRETVYPREGTAGSDIWLPGLCLPEKPADTPQDIHMHSLNFFQHPLFTNSPCKPCHDWMNVASRVHHLSPR